MDEKVARDIIATNGALILENIRVMENIIVVNDEIILCDKKYFFGFVLVLLFLLVLFCCF